MRVSIATPVYSVARYIERCARSLFAQSYGDLEFVFVDDASPDDSLDILKNLLPLYPERRNAVKIIRHPVNWGLSAARNMAVEHCTGEFVLHVDSDDYLEEDAIERLVALQAETGADIVSGDAVKHTASGDYPLDEPDYPDKSSMLQTLAGQIQHHMIWGRLIRRSLYTNFCIKAEEGCNVGEDWQVLVPLVFHSSAIAHLKHPIYHYNCTNPTSYMTQKGSETIHEGIARQDFRSLEIVKEFIAEKIPHLYSLIKKNGRNFAHEMMGKCVRQGNRSLFRHFSQRLNADRDSYDRSVISRLIDGSFFAYLLYFNYCRILRKLSFTANS